MSNNGWNKLTVRFWNSVNFARLLETNLRSVCVLRPPPLSGYAKDGTLKFLVANKIDESKRVVTTEQGKALADELSMLYFETSAKENKNIDEMMSKVAKACLDAKDKD